MVCDEVLKLLDDYIDKLVSDERAAEIKMHLEGCKDCQSEESGLRTLVNELASLPKEIEPPPAVWERISTTVSEPTPEDVEEIKDDFVHTLGEAVALRRVDLVGELLGPYIPAIARLNPCARNAARLLSYFAQWIDMGFFHINAGGLVSDHLEHLKRAISRIPRSKRGEIPAQSVGYLRFSEGTAALLQEEFDNAIADLQVVLDLEVEMHDPDVVATANWLLGRAHMRKGHYMLALQHSTRAQEIARKSNRYALEAVAQVSEGWILFQRGDHESAMKGLDHAKLILSGVGDHRSLGFIAVALGRIAKREGHYGLALDYFDEAYNEHGCGSSQNPDQARALERKAWILYLMSRRDQQNDQVALELCEEAFRHLIAAESIFRRFRSQIGLGLVHLTRTFLYIRTGDLPKAEAEVAEAYRLGKENANPILMARAKILGCKIELSKVAEKSKDKPPGYHFEQALAFAEEAIDLAKATENNRLLAKAHIWRGLTLRSDYFNRIEEARKSYETADRLLQPKGGDNVREHFDLLRSRLEQSLGSHVLVAP